MAITLSKILETFKFLDEKTAKEAFVYDVLMEIQLYQKKFEKGAADKFATREVIQSSTNLKIPFTHTRTSSINYILDLLKQRFPESVATLYSFDFGFNEKTKKLSMSEFEEFTILLANSEIERLQNARDKKSLESMIALLSKFRIFNFTKLYNQAKDKKKFAQIVSLGNDKQFFIFKNYESTKGGIFEANEFCFCSNNYNAVKKSLDIKKIKAIITLNHDLIKTKLKKYGIPSCDFTDYTDPKLDYILHVMTEDMKSDLSLDDQVEAKNFKSLRDCIKRADLTLDPSKIYNNDIIKFIRENTPTTASDIAANLLNVTTDIISNWSNNNPLEKDAIIKYDSISGTFYIYGPKLTVVFEETFNSLKNDNYHDMSSNQKDAIDMKLDLLYKTGLKIKTSQDPLVYLKAGKDDYEKLVHLIEEYETHVKEKTLRRELSSSSITSAKKISLIMKILGAIFSIFKGREEDEEQTSVSVSSSSSSESKKPISVEARTIYSKAKTTNGPILALSDYIELNKENDALIDKIINDLRENSLKIVIPVYNARKCLYPKRSSKLIIPDIEYLLVPPEISNSSELITDYIDSLVGYKLREDTIPGNTLVMIEKYLRNLYHHKRAKMKRQAAVSSTASSSQTGQV